MIKEPKIGIEMKKKILFIEIFFPFNSSFFVFLPKEANSLHWCCVDVASSDLTDSE